MTGVGSTEHVALLGVAAGGEEGVPRDALLSNSELIDRCGAGNGPISLLIKEGMSKTKAEKLMRDPLQARATIGRFFAHTVDDLIARGQIIEKDGILTLGTMPRGYDPITQEGKERRSTSMLNVVAARRRTNGWTYYINPELDEGAVARLAESMRREGWPKGHTILLDADGNVADGKHHIAAAELIGVDWQSHTKTISDELALWQEVKGRNLDRWHGAKREVAERYARFIGLRPDLKVGEKLDALRVEMTGVSERTQQRATATAKQETKQERDTTVKDGLASGKSVREVADATGIPKSTVADIAKKEEVSETRQNGGNRTAKVLGICAVCKTDVSEDERYGHPVLPKPGFIIGIEVRKKKEDGRSQGGGNMLLGPKEMDKDTFVHVDCFREPEQTAYRGR